MIFKYQKYNDTSVYNAREEYSKGIKNYNFKSLYLVL